MRVGDMSKNLTLAIALTIAGCSGVQNATYMNDGARAARKTVYAGDSAETSQDSTIIAPPPAGESVQGSASQNFSNALFVCMLQLEGFDGLSQNSVTCRYEDSSGKYFDPKSKGAKLAYSVIPSTLTNIDHAFTTIDSTERTFDMTLGIKGFAKEDANAALNNTKIKVDLVSLESNAVLASRTHLIKQVTKAQSAVKWAKVPSLASPRFMDTATGNIWTLDNQVLYTFQEAETYCQSLAPVNDLVWQVPSLATLLIGRHHGLGSALAGLETLNIRSGLTYWTTALVGTEDPTIPVTSESSLYTAEILNGDLTSQAQPEGVHHAEKQPVVCVAMPAATQVPAP